MASRSARRSIHAVSARVIVFAAIILMSLGFTQGVASAAPAQGQLPKNMPTPPFTECPAVGYNTSCSLLINVTPGATDVLQDVNATTSSDPTPGTYDGDDDTLLGIVNNTSSPISQISLSSSTLPIFGFDGDGICENPNSTSGLPGLPASDCADVNTVDTTGYGGPNSYFTGISTDLMSGTVNFIVPIPPGGSTYFSLEDPITPVDIVPPTSLTTSLSGGGQSGTSITVPPNTAVTDAATLSGTNATIATGTVTYNVYSDASCTTAVSTGTPETVSGGVVPSSSPLKLSAAGTYYWQAFYTSGDTNNGSSMSTCGSEIETVKAASGSIEVCKTGNVSNPTPAGFPYSINGGATFYVGVGQCVTQAVTAGENLVTELLDPTGASVLQSIKVAPTTANIVHKVKNSKSQAGYAKVDVSSGADVTVTFKNEPATGQLKVCKIAGSSVLNGQYFSFTEQAGGTIVGPFSVQAEPASAPLNCGGLTSYPVGTVVNIAEAATPNVTVTNVTGATWTGGQDATATVQPGGTTVVTYTNSTTPPPPNPGYLEICKTVGDSFVGAGPWNFTISGNGITPISQSVLAGQCSGDVPLLAGDYTVTESFSSPDYVSSIKGDPTAPVSTNLANGSGVFAVSAGTPETATFTNKTLTSQVKVCKTLPDNEADAPLSGTTFDFNVSDVVGTQTVPVIAPAIGQTACTIDPVSLPLGSQATITEQAQANVAVTGVQVIPASANGSGTTSTSADVIVVPGIASASFTNEALGYVEVCKTAADASTSGVTFNFSVNGGSSFPVVAGQCSAPFQVPAGTATVQELETNPNFYLQSVTAEGYPEGNALISGPTSNGTVTVAVPFGGVGNETVVTYTDAVQKGQFKICTQESSPDANLAGQSFTYNYSVTDDGVTPSGSVTLTEPASPGITCSGLITGVPVVNPLADGGGVPQVTITSVAPTVTDVNVTGITYGGNGKVLSSPSLPSAFPATQIYSIGAGANVSTFTNGRTA
jgi:hypothetical protein